MKWCDQISVAAPSLCLRLVTQRYISCYQHLNMWPSCLWLRCIVGNAGGVFGQGHPGMKKMISLVQRNQLRSFLFSRTPPMLEECYVNICDKKLLFFYCTYHNQVTETSEFTNNTVRGFSSPHFFKVPHCYLKLCVLYEVSFCILHAPDLQFNILSMRCPSLLWPLSQFRPDACCCPLSVGNRDKLSAS